jgi:hypothetical protein
MSTSETDEFDVGPCPCGRGKIIKRVTTQDNPWSSTDISYALVCAHCGGQWRVEHGSLVNSNSEKEFKVAQVAERQTYEDLERQIRPLVNGYFEAFLPKTKKAQHAEMVRLGLSSSTYRSFLGRRRDAKCVADACYPLGNKKWLAGLAQAAGSLPEFIKSLGAYEEAKQHSSEAYGRIVRWSFPKSKSIP